MKAKRELCILLIAAVLTGILGGCYDSIEVDDLAYVIAIGIDKAKTNRFRVTLQFALPLALGTGSSGGGGGGDGGRGDENKSVYNLTIEAPSILSGINMANNIVSKQISLSHTKVIVFSKEMASEGIGDFMARLSKNREIRPNTSVLICRESSEEFLKAVKPQLSFNTAKYYEQGAMTHERTGVTVNTQLYDFYIKAKSFLSQPVVALAGINKYESSDEFKTGKNATSNGNDESTIFQGELKAGEIPRVAKNKAEICGLAVFDGSRMVGELDGLESIYHLMASGEYRFSNITIQDPLNKKDIVILGAKKSRNPIHKVEMKNGKPDIYVKVMLEADILTVGGSADYLEPGTIRILKMEYERMLKAGIENYLYRTSKEFHADICGFGDHMSRKFLTWGEWEKFNWLQRYKDATFNVEVDMAIRRPGLTVRSMPIISSEGVEQR